ncbi:hypothetical protein [Rahnella aquatilis]|uniref:hypothetical protein n=1 Tax=Rahnella aquatilis TaxID=34038 RepID=UPI003666A46E
MAALIALISQVIRRIRVSFAAEYYSLMKVIFQNKTLKTNMHMIFPHAAQGTDVQVERGLIKRGKAEVNAVPVKIRLQDINPTRYQVNFCPGLPLRCLFKM